MNQLHEYKRMGQSVSRLALPVLVEQFFIVIMGVVNTMLASNMGPEAISAIGMVDSISHIFISVFGALAVGGTVVVAQYTGREDRKSANQAAGQALTSCLMISGVVTAFIFISQRLMLESLFDQAEAAVMQNAHDYFSIVLWSYLPLAMTSVTFGILRGAGDTRTPMLVSIIMNVLNVIFSYSLIYGLYINLGFWVIQTPAYGVSGAATGITMARMAGMLLILIPIFRGSKDIQLTSLHHFRLRKDMLKRVFQLGIPAGAEQLMFNGGKLVVQTFIVSLGTASMAANAITGSVNSMIMIPGNALSIAATALVGQLIGRGQPQEAKKQLKFLVVTASAAMLLLSLILFPMLRLIIGLYTSDTDTASLAFVVLVSSLIAQPLFWPGSFILPGGLRGAGDVTYTMVISIISMWVIRIFLGYIFALVLPLGVLGIWLAMYLDWLIRSVFFALRLKGRKWLQKSVID